MLQLLLTVFLLTAGIAQATETVNLDAKQILQRMVKAMEITDYQGTVIFHKNDVLEAMKYFHSPDADNQSHERLVSLNSPQREITRKSSEVRCLFKATKRLIVDHRPYQHSFIVDVPKNIDDLLHSYNFEVSGEEEVAMMPSYILNLQPKDELRFLRKIWVTKAHFLPVKAVIYALSGEVLEQVVFSEFQVNKTVSQVTLTGKDTVKSVSSPEESINPSFTANALPPGFKQIFFTRKPIHQSSDPVDHLILGDGLASVSVYVENRSPSKQTADSLIPEGMHSVGAVNSISRNIANSQITVLGEVPAITVKMIADGIELKDQHTTATSK